VAKIKLVAEPALGALDVAIGKNRIRERDDLAMVSVATPLGHGAAVAKALKAAFKLDVPKPTQSAGDNKMRAVSLTADQVMLIFAHATPDANSHVQSKLGGVGYTTDQTDAWVAIEVSGPDVHAALERICPVDLHPGAFPVGASARTTMEHMGAMIVRLSDDAFLLASARSSAASFAHAVTTSFEYVV